MLTKLDEAKTDLIGRAVEAAEKGPDAIHDPELGAFLTRYYRHVAAEDLLGRDASDVLGAALSHRRLAADRPVGSARVRVFTPSVEDHGWMSAHTVVEVVTDDMPFL
ncbi:MAG: NAD-glutamate dehydrogenase, partial [Actinomycetota bacterium]|nr:NAD-glutamate dehydrogenase [Actinomycetota bacterium]